MDKILEITLLYDFYSELLTDKQKSVMELYYLNDLSLNEIGETFGISRQAVHDMILRTEKILRQYEDKLFLVKKYLINKEKLSHIINLLNNTIETNKLFDIYNFKEINKLLSEFLD